MPDLISLLRPSDEVERCGLIVNDEIVEITNVHTDPANGFRMDPAQLLAHIGEAQATWHTHWKTDPNLSQDDYAGFNQWPNLVHHIIGVRDGVVTLVSYKLEDQLVIIL